MKDYRDDFANPGANSDRMNEEMMNTLGEMSSRIDNVRCCDEESGGSRSDESGRDRNHGSSNDHANSRGEGRKNDLETHVDNGEDTPEPNGGERSRERL